MIMSKCKVRNELESCRKECKVLRERLTSCEETAGQKTCRFASVSFPFCFSVNWYLLLYYLVLYTISGNACLIFTLE